MHPPLPAFVVTAEPITAGRDDLGLGSSTFPKNISKGRGRAGSGANLQELPNRSLPPSRSIDRCVRVRSAILTCRSPSGGAPHRGGVGSMMNGWLEGRSRSRSRSAIDRRKHPCRRWSILIRSDPPSARGSPRGPGGQMRYDREFALGKRKTGTSRVPKSGGKVAVRALSGLITELLLVFSSLLFR